MASKAVESAWQQAEKQIEAKEHDAALETLRGVWGEEGADVARTWRLAGDAKAGLARASKAKKVYRDAASHYEKALKHSPSDKQARRAMNSLRSEMDGLGISAGGSAMFWDDGAPTFVGVVSIVLAIGLMLVSLKLVPEYLAGPVDAEADASITIELYPDAAPKHVESFKLHANNGAYEGSVFHRIIDNFMVQGGDFQNGDGTGGYSAKFYGYCNGQQQSSCDQTAWTIPDEANNGRVHVEGALSMAKTNAAHTGGSQFFLVDKGSTPSHLDGKHTVFGQATDGEWLGDAMAGIDVIDQISVISTDGNDYPTERVPTIKAVLIEGDSATLLIDMVDAEGNAMTGPSGTANSLPGPSALAGLGILALAALARRRE